jgi:glutaminyl-peptide cyclotransferase
MEHRMTHAQPRNQWGFWTACFIFFMGCSPSGSDAPSFDQNFDRPQQESTEPQQDVVIPNFNADSAYRYIEQQVDFGPRVPNTPPHEACGAWLASELDRHGAEVTVQTARVRAFDGTILNIQNIIGSFAPERKGRVLLYAHWDTRPFADKDSIRQREPIDGADDGGSGVGVLLEVARHLGADSLDVGVDIIFFDAEDYGTPEWAPNTGNSHLTWCLGSQFWANQPHAFGYQAKYGILLDMVGAEDARFNMEGTSMSFAPALVKKIWKAADRLGHGNLFTTEVTPQTIDDNLFVSQFAGIPSANIVHYRMRVLPMGYGPHHHTHADNMEVISTATLQSVGEVVMDVVWRD